MSVEDKKRIYRLADRLNMRFHHFAKGTYPCFSRTRFTVNRLILVLENPNGEKNYIEDAAERRIMHPGSSVWLRHSTMSYSSLMRRSASSPSISIWNSFPGSIFFPRRSDSLKAPPQMLSSVPNTPFPIPRQRKRPPLWSCIH